MEPEKPLRWAICTRKSTEHELEVLAEQRPVLLLAFSTSTSAGSLTIAIETFKTVSMSAYKRNQVEEAISRVLDPRAQERTSELRTRLKRLLDTDRARSARSEAYAFYSAEPPGSGTEVMFSDYEACALLTALQIMAHGWPQGFAVSVLRSVREEFEPMHSRILKMDEKTIFDQDAIRRKARAGDLAFDTTDPVLLTIVSRPPSAVNDNEPVLCSICEGPQAAIEWVRKTNRSGQGFTMFELVSPAFRLAKELAKTEPRRRGPSV